MCLIMFFTYMESGANLARIYREYHERDVYLTEQAANGVQEVTYLCSGLILRQNTVMVIIRISKKSGVLAE